MRARFGPRLRFVRLFGSWARARAHEGSDIDLAVVVDDLTRAEWREVIGEIAAIEQELDVIIGPYVVSSSHFDEVSRRERRIARDILGEGVPL